MKSVLFYFLFYYCFISTSSIDSNGLNLENTELSAVADSYFHLSTDYKSFIGAWISCQTGGMNLASIKTAEEQAVVAQLIQNETVEEGYWIGGVSESISNDWYWTDTSTRVVYTNWGTGQPKTYGQIDNGSCLRLGNFYGVTEITTWQAVECVYRLKYICKM